MRWIAQRSHLQWRQWDQGEHVVYHADSGETHFLNESAAEVLRFLERQPAGIPEVMLHLRERGKLAGDQTRETIEALVDRFEDLGLVELVR